MPGWAGSRPSATSESIERTIRWFHDHEGASRSSSEPVDPIGITSGDRPTRAATLVIAYSKRRMGGGVSRGPPVERLAERGEVAGAPVQGLAPRRTSTQRKPR